VEVGNEVSWDAELEQGIHVVSGEDLYPHVERLYKYGEDRGVSTGWPVLDKFLTIKKGELFIGGGQPSHGKSEWWDSLMCNLAHSQNWRFQMFTPENQHYSQHVRKLIEKKSGLRMDTATMPRDVFLQTRAWVHEHFSWVDIKAQAVTLDRILSVFLNTADEFDGFVIDPWNAVEHKRGGLPTTEYISLCLTVLGDVARRKNKIICVIAHPNKMYRNKDGAMPIPSLGDLADSYTWNSKADVGFIAHREDTSVHGMDLYISKVRWKATGKPGKVKFDYNWENGRFSVGGEHGLEDAKKFVEQIECPF